MALRLTAALSLVFVLACASLLVGATSISLGDLVGAGGQDSSRVALVMLVSRVPRTVAIVLAGASMSVAGLLMQQLARNRFVAPSTAGTVESASLGILVVTMLAPATPVFGKMLVAALLSVAGTGLFLAIIQRLSFRSIIVVPLIGLMFGGVIAATTDFFAYRFDLLQTLSTWTNGDFSGVLRGRYELLWVAAALTVVSYWFADRITVAGMGEDFAANLGVNHRVVVGAGLAVVSLVTAVVVVTVGAIPFLGLLVPNLVSMVMGDHARRTLPWVAVSGAAFVLACDLLGRLVRHPYEIPIGTVVGVVGSVLFLFLLLRRPAHA